MPFETTMWEVVEEAQGHGSGADDALAILFETYWRPLYLYSRRRGMAEEEAKAAVQGFFLRVVEKRYFDSADGAKGRFRTFLLTCFRRYLANDYKRVTAQKREGKLQRLSIDWDLSGSVSLDLISTDTPADVLYDREWAFSLIARSMERLHEQESAAGRSALVEALGPTLFGGPGASVYDRIGRDLGMSQGAVKVAAYRIRKRLRLIILEEVRRTVGSAASAEDELQFLLGVVRDAG